MRGDGKINLILVADRRFDWHDFEAIAHQVVAQAPDIAVHLVARSDTAAALPEEKWRRPSITVSFGGLGRFNPPRGAVFTNRPISKLDQYARLRAAGIDVPRTERFRFGRPYREDEWGEFVVLKPLPLTLTSKGGSARLIRTRRLERLEPRDFPPEHVLSQGPALVQQFVDTGEYPTNWRVLTLFGEPLESLRSRTALPRPPLTASDQEIEAAIIEPKHPRFKTEFDYAQFRSFEKDEEILAFARRIERAFPAIPLKGCDILREALTGRLFAIEINAGGNTWHFSSASFARNRDLLGGRDVMVRQFDAWRTAAAALIRQARTYAT